MAEPTTVISCVDACTVTVIHELSLPPLQLSPAEGALIAGAILAIWAIGFGFRALIRTLSIGGNIQPEDNS